jgi:HEAT repeat protein
MQRAGRGWPAIEEIRMSAILITLILLVPFGARVSTGDEVDDAIASLEKALKEKANADVKHFAALLGDKFAGAKPEQQKTILKLHDRVLGHPDQEIKDAALEAIAKTDARAVPTVIKEMDKKTTEDNVAHFANCIKTLGRLKDPKAGKDRLLKLLKHKSIDVASTAVEALANYKDASMEAKKEIVEDILKMYGSFTSAANNPRDSTAQSKLKRFQGPADESLRGLTGQQIQGHPAWLKWWNDTGKKADKW